MSGCTCWNCATCAHSTLQKILLSFTLENIIHEIGIVLSGSVNIENIDLWGNKSILSNIPAGQVFAESYALCQEPMMVDAVTAEAADILFLISRF